MMARSAAQATPSELNRIYEDQIRPDVLAGAEASDVPSAILVVGPIGAIARSCATQVSRLTSTGTPAQIPDAALLGPYHPGQNRLTDNRQAAAVRHDLDHWKTRLIADAIQMRADIIVALDPASPEDTSALALALRQQGYRCTLRAAVADRDACRQLAIARLDRLRATLLKPAYPHLDDVDRAYIGLRATVSSVQRAMAVDRIQVVTISDRPLADDERVGDRWTEGGAALRALDDYRDRQRPARELADSVLRWHTLVQRVAVDPSVPRDLASQVLQWRDQAVQAAQQHPEASRFIAWGLEAEAFRKLDRSRFAREFPGSRRAVDKLDEAIRYADREFDQPIDRARFIDQARDRIAERIAEGRIDGPTRTPTKEPDPKVP